MYGPCVDLDDGLGRDLVACDGDLGVGHVGDEQRSNGVQAEGLGHDSLLGEREAEFSLPSTTTTHS